MELEARHARLCAELAELEARLRALRLAADLCPQCGGTGRRWVRGGLYGEWQQQPCPCRPNPATDAPAGSPNPETGRR